MNLDQLLPLLNERFSGFHTLWSFYITVAVGLLAYVAATFTTAAASGVRLVLICAFVLFAAVNLHALLDVRAQRDELSKLALRQIAAAKQEGKLQDIDAKSLELVVERGRPDPHAQVLTFHLISDALAVLVIWYVPGAIARARRIVMLERTPVVPRHRRYATPALLSRDEVKGVWCLADDFEIETSKGTLSMPGGFEFDLASIPRAFWWLLAPFELSVAAPLVHDYLYSNAGKATVGSSSETGNQECSRVKLTRADVDLLFLELMKYENVPWWRRLPAYAAVRVFGELAWARR